MLPVRRPLLDFWVMTSRLSRILGAVAGLGSAVLWWFMGHMLAPTRHGTLMAQMRERYALLAFLLVPALILAAVALFWVPPRMAGGAPLREGWRWRAALVVLFAILFAKGLAS